MEIYRLENVSFKYPSGKSALNGIGLTINSGEFITVCGKSGCGKTTLLRLLKPEISPHGELLGKMLFCEKKIADLKEGTAREIGFVMQNPENQIVTDSVWHEMSFGLENLGIKTPEIRARVAEMASFFGIENWFYKRTSELSGGQKQILNLASVMIMQPKVLILDEPTSRLDPIAAEEFLKTVKKINQELGTTVIIAEHRLQETFSISDRVIVMEDGRIIADTLPSLSGRVLKENKWDMYCALPVSMRVFESVSCEGECPVTIRDGRKWLSEYVKNRDVKSIAVNNTDNKKDTVIDVKEAFFRYGKNEKDVINNLSLSVRTGEIMAILGGNGAGKTTALSLICGINKAQRGKVLIKGKDISEIADRYSGLLGVLPQEPQTLFSRRTVFEELFDMTDKNMIKEQREKEVSEISKLCRISEVLDSHPYDLSGGEQQRTALAMILLKRPQILLLDEPTKGMDAYFKSIFADILKDLKKGGVTVLMVSHDLDFCAEIADRCALFYNGAVASVLETREFFRNNCFYTTYACRMAKGIIENAVTIEDIICAIGGKEDIKRDDTHFDYKKSIDNIKKAPEKKINPKKIVKGTVFLLFFSISYMLKLSDKVDFFGKSYILGGASIIFVWISLANFLPKKAILQTGFKKTDSRVKKRTKIAAFLILLLIPATILFGVYFLSDRRYYFISLLIILETLLPFLMIFEGRKAEAREIVLVSVLCALGVAGRTAFFMIPEFKPLLTIIIISGISMGGEVGFTVGAMTGFVSNFFFGQGPWTPWQMFALGIIGFIAGALFRAGLFKTKLSLCVFGFFSALVIYGGIMNPASVLMVTHDATKEMFYSAYLMGLPVDLIHAMSTALFLWFLTEPMIEKLERVKTKYGLLEDR